MTTVLCAGVAVADFVFQVDAMPEKPEKYRANDAAITGGGCAANAAVAVARQGGNALLAARLGSDAVGDLIISDLEAEHVNTSLINRAHNAASSFSSIYVDAKGERQIMNFRGKGLAVSAGWLDAKLDPNIELHAVLADNRWSPLTQKAMEIAKSRKLPAIIDVEAPVNADELDGATHLAFSMQGLEALTGEALARPNLADSSAICDALLAIANTTGAWACVTDGPNGVWYSDGNTCNHIPAFQVHAVDTLGAGDIWHGVFALKLGQGETETAAIRVANAAAAIKCTRFGGRSACPDAATTQAFLKENRSCN